MQFTPKLLLTTFICATGAQLTHSSQAQSSSALATQAAPSAGSQERARLAEAAVQAAVAQLQRASTQGTNQTTGQEIVERDPKRQKMSQENNAQGANEQTDHGTQQERKTRAQTRWLLQYAKKLSPEAQERIKQDKIREIEADRIYILPQVLYDILTYMPKELTNLISDYDDPYELQGKLDQTFKITLPKDVKITAITPLLLPHGNILVISLSDGCLGILKEQTDKQTKESWALEQTIQADKSAITAIADLKDQKFATGSAAGALTIWTPKQNGTIILTGISIKKIATLSNGNIVVGGTVGERAGQWQIWDPVTLKKLYSHQIEDFPFIDLLVLPDDRIIVNKDFHDLEIYKQTTNTWVQEEYIEAPSWCQVLRSLNLLPNNDILRCGYTGGFEPDGKKNIQMHILDHDNYDRCSHVLQANDPGGEHCGPITILSCGDLAVNINTELTDPKTDATDNIEIFDTSDTRYQLKIYDNILAIPLSDYKTELQHLIVLPDGRLLGAFKDGTISIWR
jgi:hypothetical protein